MFNLANIVYTNQIKNLFAQVNLAVDTSWKQERLAVRLMIIVLQEIRIYKAKFLT